MVHLGGGHACHVSKWIHHCNGEEVDIFGSDAEEEYVEPEPQPEEKEVQEPLSKKKKWAKNVLSEEMKTRTQVPLS